MVMQDSECMSDTFTIFQVFIYPKAQGPQYQQGHTIILGLLCAGWFL